MTEIPIRLELLDFLVMQNQLFHYFFMLVDIVSNYMATEKEHHSTSPVAGISYPLSLLGFSFKRILHVLERTAFDAMPIQGLVAKLINTCKRLSYQG
jgi:hypothetical protein